MVGNVFSQSLCCFSRPVSFGSQDVNAPIWLKPKASSNNLNGTAHTETKRILPTQNVGNVTFGGKKATQNKINLLG